MALDGVLHYYDGLILIVLYIFFIYLLKNRKAEEEKDKKTTSMGAALLYLGIGICGIAVGADAVVESAVTISVLLGVKEITIAASIVAIGTSLPELVTTIVASVKKHYGIAIGNVIGSNLMNVCLVLGIASVVREIPILLRSPVVVFFLVSALIIPIVLKKNWIGKKTGISFIALYALFLILLYVIK